MGTTKINNLYLHVLFEEKSRRKKVTLFISSYLTPDLSQTAKKQNKHFVNTTILKPGYQGDLC